MSNTYSPSKATLWIWPLGLYPRRVIYYLKAKKLSRSVLDTVTIIPVSIDTSAGTLLPPADAEPRPENTSLPVLRVGDQLITQASTVLSYLEDAYSSSASAVSSSYSANPSYRNFSGTTPLDRARIADLVNFINESLIWTNVYLRHTTSLSRKWTGMAEADQSLSAAMDAKKQWHNAMLKLEGMVLENIMGKGCKSLAGRLSSDNDEGDDETPSLADFTLMAARTYVEEMYGWDLFEGCEVLKVWEQRAQKEQWFVDRETCERIDKEGLFDELFVN